jgi:outer membrane protein assembly factor BamB
VIVLAVAIGLYVRNQNDPPEKRGSATEEFVVTEEPEPKPPPKKENRRPWPTYGYDNARQHISPYEHRPPFKRLWTIDAHDTLEFPPAVGYGRVYLAQQKGLFFALDAETGRPDWKKSLGRCAASSPTIGRGVVYVSYMHHVECLQGQEGADGFVVAWDADTGRELWRYRTAPVESSPLLRGRRLFVGSWDHGVHALNARTGKRIWRFEADNEVNTSAAYWRGRIFIGSDSGTLYALSAKTGRLLWSQRSGSGEFWYATPTIAYGRVFIGNASGTLYAFGASSGRLLWAQNAGTYIYTAAAVWRGRVYVGTYDGNFHAFNAATGDRLWRFSASAAIHGAPSVIDGLVYFAACPRCGSVASRYAKQGDRGTYALDALTGRQVWHWPDGVFSPAVADSQHLYIAGRSRVFSFAPKRRAQKRPARKQRAKRSTARSSRSSGRRGRGRGGGR